MTDAIAGTFSTEQRGTRQTRAFTLVELLVVIGIIALLISILLPSLAKARRAAQTVACAANIRSILQAANIFASQNNGYIPGSVYSSGRFLFKVPKDGKATSNIAAGSTGTFSNTNCPSIVHYSDWASPLAKIMNVKFDEGHDRIARAKRWATMRDLKQFHCPSNEITAVQFGSNLINDAASGTVVTHGRMFSYCTAMGFLLTDNKSGTTSTDLVGVSISRPDWNVPSGYNAKMSKVGDPSRKVFIADGAKWSNPTTPPDVDLSFDGQLGGPFADQGPTKFTRAWGRDRIPVNGTATGLDTRIFWARHGSASSKSGAGSGAFRFNVGFFDGHVETLDDLTGSNPLMYYPKGTSLITTRNGQMYNDIFDRFFQGAPSPVIVP